LRYYLHKSRKAAWGYRIATLSILVFAVIFIWHRFFQLPTPLALKFFGIAVAGALISLAISAIALVNIWNEGYLGAVRASFAVFASCLILAVPLSALPGALTLPKIHDITTDTVSPPAFDRVAKIRQGIGQGANAVRYDASLAPLQAAAYPGIKPFQVPRSVVDVYSSVREVVTSLNWKIIDEQAAEPEKTGHIEAVDRTLVFGFADDVIVRVGGTNKTSIVDVRSSSRFGEHDLGRNAKRIRQFMAELKIRLAQMDRSEQMEREVSSREEEKARRKRAGDDDKSGSDSRGGRNQVNQGKPIQPNVPPLNRSERTPDGGRSDQAASSSQDPSQSSARAEQKPPRQPRQRDRVEGLRRFWEQVGQ